MKTTIKLGEDVLPVRSSGLTAVIYKNLFGGDLIATIYAAKDDSDELKKFETFEVFARLAFVMNWQAENTKDTIAKSKELSINDFYEWLDNYDQMDLYNEAFISAVVNCWIKSATVSVQAKNV